MNLFRTAIEINAESAESRLKIDVFHDLVPKRFSNFQIQADGAKAFAFVGRENFVNADHIGQNRKDLMAFLLFSCITQRADQLAQLKFRNVNGTGDLHDAVGNVLV